MTYYNAKAERERAQRDTPERILEIARIKGQFEVSLRWRDDALRARCQKLRKAGKLTGGRRIGDRVIFYLAKPAPATKASPDPRDDGEK